MKIKLTSFIPAIAWFLITIFLLCLPGNDLPDSGFFSIPYFDKLVHFGMFFLLTYLFSLPLKQAAIKNFTKKKWFLKIAIYSFMYGVIMEFVQSYFVPYRSYDNWDIVVDGIGCFSAYMWSMNFYFKRDEV